jgi:hypothetical protein
MKSAILRNKHRNLAGLMIASVFALAACGGGGGGSHGGLATGEFTRSFNPTDDATFASSYFSPTTYHSQSLYLASAINGSGRITKIRVQYASAEPAAITCPDVTIKMGHTSVTSPTGLSTTFANNVQQGRGAHQTVLANGSIVFPVGVATNWHEIVLGAPFDYNGVDNLIVEITVNTVCDGTFNTDVEAALPYTSHIWDANPANLVAAGSGTFLADMQFVFAGGDNKLDFGGVGTNTWPFDDNNAAGGLRIQSLYLASEINGSGPITGIAYQTNATTVAGTYSYSLSFGHSTLSALTINYASNYSGSPTMVANAVANFTIPAGVPAGEWIWIPIPEGVFTYNGTDNLIVDVSTTAGSATNSWRVTSIAGRRAPNNGAASTTAAIVDGNANHITLRFNGGPMAVITPGGMAGGIGDAMPFWAINGKRQYLYRAAELGTGGTISKLACRAVLSGAAETNFNYTVILSHSTASTLGTTYATNLATPTTVFSGVLNIPAVLVGDWLEIPFSTPFGYNGKDNLVVEVSGTGGTASGSACAMDLANAARYTGRRVFSGGSSDAAGTLQDNLIDMRFTLN